MVKESVKTEIIGLLEQISEDQLLEVLGYLRELADLSEMDSHTGDKLSKIMFEDDNLLHRLAQ